MDFTDTKSKRIVKAIALILLLFIQFQYLVSAEGESDKKCVEYEPTVVTLVGTLKPETHPGLPNFYSVEEGDEPLDYWFLYLEKPICLLENPDVRMMDYEEFNVKKLQIVFTSKIKGDYSKYRYLLNRRVRVRGTLYHSHTGWHKTRILITAYSIKYAGK